MPDVLADIWDQILRCVQKGQPQLWRSWFEQVEPIALQNGTLRASVTARAEQQYLERHCSRAFRDAAQQVTGHLISVEFLCDENQTDPHAETSSVREEDMLYLSPDYTFDHFVVGPCNRLAHAACIAISESPGEAYNPLFIHGAVGLGKTHLLQAACQSLLRRRAGHAQIAYLSCETFVNHFIHAVEQGKIQDFRYRYRHADCLVIDDVQFLSERESSQEEFFHTFNTLYQARKQIVLSADCSPAEIPKLEARLVSRFQQGLVARIDKPDYETRMAIIHKKAQLRGITPPEEVISLIARKIVSNTRELEGALTKIHGLALLEGGDITLDLARAALGEEPAAATQRVSMSQIIDAVIDHFGVRLSDLQGKRRSRSIAFPRQVCMYLARDLTNHSLEEIGGHFGGRDHTTVLHAYRTIDRLVDTDETIRLTVNELIGRITSREHITT